MSSDSETTGNTTVSVVEEVVIKTTHTKTVRVVLTNFLNEIKENDEDKPEERVIESPEFEIAGYKLVVDVYPKSCEPGFIGIYFRNKNDVDLTASLSFELLGETDEFKKATVEMNEGFGSAKLMSHEKFKAWAEEKKDDILEILATVTLHLTNQADKKTNWITGRKKKMSEEDSPKELLKKMCSKKIFTDFTIESNDGAKFPCHRAVLGTKSGVMMAMMEADMREKKESTLRLDYNGQIVKVFVDSFYDEEVDKNLIAQEIGSFLDLAESYDLAGLKSQTESVAIGMLNTENMVEMFFLAKKYNAEELKTAAETFIRSNKTSLQGQEIEDTLREAYKDHAIDHAIDIIRILCK